MKIENLDYALNEMYDFITDLPSGLDGFESDFDAAFAEREKVKSDDVVTVTHGRWIDKGWDGDFYWKIDGRGNCWRVIECSICGAALCGSQITNFCPHCGAKMDLGE